MGNRQGRVEERYGVSAASVPCKNVKPHDNAQGQRLGGR